MKFEFSIQHLYLILAFKLKREMRLIIWNPSSSAVIVPC